MPTQVLTPNPLLCRTRKSTLTSPWLRPTVVAVLVVSRERELRLLRVVTRKRRKSKPFSFYMFTIKKGISLNFGPQSTLLKMVFLRNVVRIWFTPTVFLRKLSKQLSGSVAWYLGRLGGHRANRIVIVFFSPSHRPRLLRWQVVVCRGKGTIIRVITYACPLILPYGIHIPKDPSFWTYANLIALPRETLFWFHVISEFNA